jgi:hypothetical protein
MYTHRCHAVARKKVPEFYRQVKLAASSMLPEPAQRACAGYAQSGLVRPGQGVAAPRRRHDLVGAKAANASNWSVAGPPPQ